MRKTFSACIPATAADVRAVRGVDPEAGLHEVRVEHDGATATELDAGAWDAAVALGRRAVAGASVRRRMSDDESPASPPRRRLVDGSLLFMIAFAVTSAAACYIVNGPRVFVQALQDELSLVLQIVPVIIGAGGVEQIVEINLDADAKANLQVSVDAVKELLVACKGIDSSLG